MRAAHSPRSLTFVSAALLVAVALLAWFTVIVKQAETRGQHRRAYQQLTGEIMMPLQADGRRAVGRKLSAKQEALAIALAQR